MPLPQKRQKERGLLMMTVTARAFVCVPRFTGRENGVALLQVLLLSALLSLIAIRFSETARDQLGMASDLESRVKAQMAAHSTFNQVIFSQLSESIDLISPDLEKPALAFLSTGLLNRYGEPVQWTDGITVKTQDLNGLLPQIFPQHILWRALLEAWPLPQKEVNQYLGVWADIQDSDTDSWNFGDKEPQKLPNGGQYLNGYAQNGKIVEWLFSGHPELASLIESVSDVDGAYDTNLLNSPAALLTAVMEPDIANALIVARGVPGVQQSKLAASIPSAFRVENIYVHDSTTIVVDVKVALEKGHWAQRKVLDISLGGESAFTVLRNQ